MKKESIKEHNMRILMQSIKQANEAGGAYVIQTFNAKTKEFYITDEQNKEMKEACEWLKKEKQK